MLFFRMNQQSRLAIISIIAIIPLAAFYVLNQESKPFSSNLQDSKLQVISSFYPLYEFSKSIGQDKVEVSLLVPMGIEPHDWEPTIQDVQKIQKSDLIIINGIGFEEWVHDLEEMGYAGTIVDTSNGIQIMHNEKFETDERDEHDENDKHDKHNHDENDPHIWLDPTLVKIQVKNIADSFSKKDPVNENFYQKNAENYIQELDELDSKIKNELQYCKKDFIAFHNAFSYFSEQYGLNQYTIINSLQPHSEPTAKTLESVIKTAQNLNIQIIFSEETADPRTSKVIADELGGKVLTLSPIEIGNDLSYIERMTQNLNNLKEALC